jgi:hypothetical protein
MRMAEVKTSSPLSHQRAGEHHATPHALAAHHAVTARRACAAHALAVRWSVGHPKGRRVGPSSWALAQEDAVVMGCSEA